MNLNCEQVVGNGIVDLVLICTELPSLCRGYEVCDGCVVCVGVCVSIVCRNIKRLLSVGIITDCLTQLRVRVSTLSLSLSAIFSETLSSVCLSMDSFLQQKTPSGCCPFGNISVTQADFFYLCELFMNTI